MRQILEGIAGELARRADMDRFILGKADRRATYVHALRMARDQRHVDPGGIRIPSRLIAERVQVKLRSQIAVQALQNVADEGK